MTHPTTDEREAVCARCKNRGTIPVMHGNALCPDCGGKSYREQPYTLADAVERSGPWGIATTIGGSVMLVDESDEGAPIATFAQGDDARHDAEAIAVILAHVRSVAPTPPTASAPPKGWRSECHGCPGPTYCDECPIHQPASAQPREWSAAMMLLCDECMVMGSACRVHGDPTQREPKGILSATPDPAGAAGEETELEQHYARALRYFHDDGFSTSAAWVEQYVASLRARLAESERKVIALDNLCCTVRDALAFDDPEYREAVEEQINADLEAIRRAALTPKEPTP